jgi:lipoyl(octanoyl) transferase
MTTRLARPVEIRWRGLEAYETSFAAMREFTEQRSDDTSDEIWLVEHPPVFTLGQAGDPAHLLNGAAHGPDGLPIPLVHTDRGGQITFHGPGQVVAYLLLDLRRRKLMVRELVVLIEQAAIDTLAAYNISGERKAGAPGIYIAAGPRQGSKIAALGLKVRRGCTYHGVSLNVRMDLSPFDNINPCGYAGLETVDFHRLGVVAAWPDVAATLAERLVATLNASATADANDAIDAIETTDATKKAVLARA